MPGCAVAVLHQTLAGEALHAAVQIRLPVERIAFALGSHAERVQSTFLESINQPCIEPARAMHDGKQVAGKAVARAKVVHLPAVPVLRP